LLQTITSYFTEKHRAYLLKNRQVVSSEKRFKTYLFKYTTWPN